MNAIMDGFRRLADFRGRDARSKFWPYALVVVALSFVGLGVGMATASTALFDQLATVAAQHPEAATVVGSPGQYSVEIHDAAFMPDLTPVFSVLRMGVVVAVLLLAAAVTRRLHDTGRAGYWGLPPAIFLGVGLTVFPVALTRMMTEDTASIGLILLLFLNNIFYLISLAGLVFLLALDSQKAANRYGSPA